MEIAIIILVVAIIFIIRSVKIVPQQHAWVVERLGKYHVTLSPGLKILVPFVDRVAYKHILKEIPLVILTTSANPKDVAFCYQAGANAYHVKPVRHDHYLLLLRSLLQYWLDSVTLQVAPLKAN